MATVNTKDANDMLARAKAAQERRRSIDSMSVGGSIVLPLRETVKTYAPECIGKDRKYREFFGHPGETDKYLDKGYEPVIHNGQHVSCEGLNLFKFPVDLWQNKEKQKIARSEMMLSETKYDIDDANKTSRKSGAGKMADETFEVIKPSDPGYSK